MAFHKIELFGHIVYSPALSYDDLLTREEAVKALVQNILDEAGGEFIHFEALGDTLRFQCVLPEERESVFHFVCDKLAPQMKNGLDARMLLVDKDLDTLYAYTVTGGKWQEAVIGLPAAGFFAAAQPVELASLKTHHPQLKK